MRNSWLFLVGCFFTLSLFGQRAEIKKNSFKVWGNCEMCKEKIESAVREIPGVKSAKWNMITQRINIKYNPDSSNLNSMQKSIANIGYDTEKFKAKDEVYNNLHNCCKYNRN